MLNQKKNCIFRSVNAVDGQEAVQEKSDVGCGHLLIDLFLTAVLGGKRLGGHLTELIRVGLNLHLLIIKTNNSTVTDLRRRFQYLIRAATDPFNCYQEAPE